MRYWDSSALVPLLVQEASTDAVRALLRRDDAVVTWWGSAVECASGLAFRRRRGTIGADVHQRALDALRMAAAGWRIVEAEPRVQENAMRLVRLHPLRAADALQLAAALDWADGQPGEAHELVTLDARLRDAAGIEGFGLLPA